MTEKFLRVHDQNICYNTTGRGQPVVLVHGFGEDSSIWDLQAEYLQDKCQLVIPDLPGCGKSGSFPEQHTGMEDLAGIIRSILDEEHIDKAAMFGHSMGGYITLAFAELYPERLTAIGLIHSTSYPDSGEKKENRKKAIEFIRKNGSEAFLRTSIPGLFFDKSNSAPANALIERGSSFLPETLIRYYEAMIARPGRQEILGKPGLPVLFIIGEHDLAVPFGQSLEEVQIPENSTIYILRNSAHMGMIEEPGKVNRILGNFLLNI